MQQCAESFISSQRLNSATERSGREEFPFSRVACCSGISTGLRYLSINSVKRGIVPDRNVLLKGICWTVPRIFCWRAAKGRRKNGGQKKEKENFPKACFISFLLVNSFMSKRGKNKTERQGKIDSALWLQADNEIMQLKRNDMEV